MQMMCTSSDRALGDGTSADKRVHGDLLAALSSVVVAGGVRAAVQALLLPVAAILSPIGMIGLIRIEHGCGPPL
jgi:hypothetical protein